MLSPDPQTCRLVRSLSRPRLSETKARPSTICLRLVPSQLTQKGVAAAQLFLVERSVPFTAGKIWTTDAMYRETRQKVDRRRAEGCLAVEMEAAAFFAVARFRAIRFAQLLYGGDDLSGAEWDDRA